MEGRRHLGIVAHYEDCLERHGDNHLGMDWPNAEDVPTRHRVMLEAIRSEDAREPLTLLDLGCGGSHLYEYIREHKVDNVEYSGLDLSPKAVELSQKKFPENTYYCVDVLDPATDLPRFDYVVMNGVFTEKRDLSFAEMRDYFERMIVKVFDLSARGIAFNVMSKHVDWERDDLFHLPLDDLGAFLTQQVSRHHVIRNDYGLYEYTAYVYRAPARYAGK